MEDGSSMPLWGVFVLIFLLWLNGIFYGFAAALRNISENDTQKKADEGDEKARMLMELIDRPAQFVNAIPLMVMASGICFGAFLVPWAVAALHTACSGSCSGSGSMCDIACRTWNPYFSPGGYLSSGEICIPLSEAGAFLGNGAQAFYLVYYLDRQTGGCTLWGRAEPDRGGGNRGGDHFHCG